MAILEAFPRQQLQEVQPLLTPLPDVTRLPSPAVLDLDTDVHVRAVAALDAFPEQAMRYDPDFINRTRQVARATLRRRFEIDDPRYLFSSEHLTEEPTDINQIVKDQADARTNYTQTLVEAGLDPDTPELSYDQLRLLEEALKLYGSDKVETGTNADASARGLSGTELGIKLGLFDGDKTSPDRQTELGRLWVKQEYENR
jgi:hypothetical protein